MLDLKLRNARIRTVDDRHPRAHTLGVFAGRIFGLDDTVEDLPARTTLDCGGAVVVPGFGDAHNHMAWFGQSLSELDLGGAATLPQVYDAVARRAAGLPADAWVVGSGYDDTVMGAHPHRAELDRAAGGRPVWLKHRSGHMCAVSSEVLRRAGILDGTTADPEGGVVVRDEHGAPTGLLQERAQGLVSALVMPYPVTDLADAVSQASAVYAAEGLTHVVEAGIGLGLIGRSPVEAAAYQLARDRGTLRTRVELMVAADNLHALRSHADDGITTGLDLGLRSGFGDDRLRLGPMKIWLDGSLIGRTAAVSEPFCGHIHGTGVFQDGPEQMRRLVVDAHRAGWRVAAHAIGDSAVDLALDAFAEARRVSPRRDVRHRIEHSGVVRPDQLDRYAELGVVPVPQAHFLYAVGDTMAQALGPGRTPWMYRHRSFLDRGIRVPGSSDRPVAPGAPLLGMQSMVERLSRAGVVLGPDERVTAEQALRAYTLDAAWASHDEDRRGSITPGKHADFVVLSDDPVDVDADRIGAIDVLATFVAGACVHGADALEDSTTTKGPLPMAGLSRPHARSQI
ncbi:amidohydrolase (plasmid) [Streptomyces sp. NBC_00841]|uniref:amidohydrolase n=1 Tax=unclassified Streptomyces TaxID=2593676 RepID=UPI0022538E1A|nr:MULTISPECIES: amidohydrolase [unclassified Streptomyces]MCX4537939.1 amidohydrolase [Streptomyces sp. NBC_01669]WSA05119.1 amidohydrolase [Streptomyces sp. NBC_00841]